MARLLPSSPVATVPCRWTVGGLLAIALGLGAAEGPAPVLQPGVDALVAEARHEIEAGAFQHARELLLRALLLDPANAEARDELARVEAIAGLSRPAPIIDREAVARQLRLTEVRVLAERAELLARQGRTEEAREALAAARAGLDGLAAHDEVEGDLRQVDDLLAEIEPLVRARAGTAAAAARRDALADAQARADHEVEIQNGVLAERIERIRAHQRRRLYELALAGAHQLVRDFPREPAAEALFEEILAQVHDQRARDLDEQKTDRLREVHRRIEESLIPSGWDGRPDFPRDWFTRDHRTADFGAGDSALESWEEDLVDRLAQRVSVAFEDAPIDEALRALADMGRFNLVVDPSVYANGGVPISLRVTDMRLDHCLNWLAQMSSQTWVLSQGAVYFGGQVDVERVLAVYDLAYLLRVPADQPGYNIGFDSGGDAGGGGGFNLFQDSNETVDQIMPEDVVDLIRSAVSPAAWEDPANAIEVRGNQLYVTAPRGLHGLLQEFIRGQASARALAVHVAARWLTIHDNALEEIGVDWGSAQSLASPDGITMPPGVLAQNATSSWFGTATNRLPGGFTNPTPPTAGTGLALSLLRLGDLQVAATLHAVERKSKGRVLSRPELVTLNGLRGNVFFGEQHAYISDYEVVNNNLDPVIEVLTVGASLDIKPFVSADRKYVTMEFRPAVASVSFFTDLITAPRVIGTGDGGGVVIPGLTFPIELPNVRIDEVSTTVIVPDGGSLMVGGFNFALDESSSAKVPVLGSIPFLGRLFGRRGISHVRERLFLLAHVRIIDYQEAEDRL